MSKALITEDYLTDIADAIRAKNGSSDTYTPAQMAGAIDSIPNYPEPTGSVAIRQNGAVNVKDYAVANVSVPNSYTVGDEGKVVQNGALIGQSDKNINANGRYNTTTNKEVVVSVPNSYTVGDEGKVVQNGALIGQSGRNINVNGRYNTTANNEVVVNVAEGGSARVIPKNIGANGNYDASSDHADGYSSVNVNVPNTYGVGDEGKVVSGGELIDQTPRNVTANGTYDTTENNSTVVNVPNTYGVGDEGKVVSGGELVAQTSTTKNANGTYDTTTNNQVVIDVPNTYTQADEGKVVDNGALVSQTSRSVTANGTYTTTTNDEVIVNVPSSEPVIEPLSVTRNGVFDVPTGVDGYAPITVNVPASGPALHLSHEHAMGSNSFSSTKFSADMAVSVKKLFLLAINSDTSNNQTFPALRAKINDTVLTSEHTEYHEYTSSGGDHCNYKADKFNISALADDVLNIGSTTVYEHSSFVYVLATANFEIGKIMSNVGAATSGSFNEDGCVLYGTLDDDQGGTVVSADYTANTVITTQNPGSGYKSSFIIWLTKASGDVTVEPLSVTQNGTYTAPTGVAYSPVTVNVSGGGSSVDPSDYAELFKYVCLSEHSGDKFIRSNRNFTRNTAEPILALCVAYLSGGAATYTGYAVISFTNSIISGTYTPYGDLTYLTAKTTPNGTPYWVQVMNGTFPPSTANNRAQFNVGNNQMYIYADVGGLVIDGDSKSLYGNADMISAMNALIDAIYLKYYAT